MVESDKWSDQRSNSRKHLRRNLLQAISDGHNDHKYACERCGRGPDALPMSSYWDKSWTIELADVDKRIAPVYDGGVYKVFQLDADHKDKDWSNNDAGNGELLCRKCHLVKDRATAKGVNPNKDDLFGYASAYVLEHLVENEDPNFIGKTMPALLERLTDDEDDD